MPLDVTEKKKAEGPIVLPGLTLVNRAVLYNRVIADGKGATLAEKLAIRNLKIAVRPTDEEKERFEIAGFNSQEGGLKIPAAHAHAAKEYTRDIELKTREAQYLKDCLEWMSALAEDERVPGGGLPNDDAFDDMFFKVADPIGLDLTGDAE